MDKTSVNLKLDLSKLIQESAERGQNAPRLEGAAPKEERRPPLSAAPPSRATKPSKRKPKGRVFVPATQVQYRLETGGLNGNKKKLAGRQLQSSTPRDGRKQEQPFRELENDIAKFAYRSDFSFDFQTEAKLSKSQPLETAGTSANSFTEKMEEIPSIVPHSEAKVALTKLLKDQNLGSQHLLAVEEEKKQLPAVSAKRETKVQGKDEVTGTAMSIAPLGPRELDPAPVDTFNDYPVVFKAHGGQGPVRAHGRALVFKSFKAPNRRAAKTREYRFGVCVTETETEMETETEKYEAANTDMEKEEEPPTVPYTKGGHSPERRYKGRPTVEVARTQFQLAITKDEAAVSPTTATGFRGHKLRAMDGGGQAAPAGAGLGGPYQHHSPTQPRIGRVSGIMPSGQSPHTSPGQRDLLSCSELGSSVAVYHQYHMNNPVESGQGVGVGPESPPQDSNSPSSFPNAKGANAKGGKSPFFKAILNADRARDEELAHYADLHMPEMESMIIKSVPGFTLDPPMAKVDHPALNDTTGLKEVLKGVGNLIDQHELKEEETDKEEEKEDKEEEATAEEEQDGAAHASAVATSPLNINIKVAVPTAMREGSSSRPTAPLNHSASGSNSKIRGVQRSIVRSVASHAAEIAVVDAVMGLSSARSQSAEPSEEELSQLTEIELEYECARYVALLYF